VEPELELNQARAPNQLARRLAKGLRLLEGFLGEFVEKFEARGAFDCGLIQRTVGPQAHVQSSTPMR
jgi:hypothetical protein